jgi:hypothetical protein
LKKITGLVFLFLSLALYSFEEIKDGIGERKCGVATKKGLTHPQIPTYKMDCSTFEHVIGSWYKDKENVYFYRDTNNMYVGFEVAEGINPENVKPLGEDVLLRRYYMSDGENIYVQNGFYPIGVIKNANIKKFRILKNGYSKDNKKIYYLATELEKADIKTFTVYDRNINSNRLTFDAKDKNNYYREGKVVK